MLALTYRDDRAVERPRTDLIGDSLWALLVAGFAIAAVFGAFSRRGLDDVFTATIWIVLAAAIARYCHRRRCYRTCLEIRVGDDGVCEFETRRRTIRLHARQIRAVKYDYDDESNRESYAIRGDFGKLLVSGRVAGFHDFVTRLKQVNPAVDVRSFPGF
jgi:hypothetical protein